MISFIASRTNQISVGVFLWVHRPLRLLQLGMELIVLPASKNYSNSDPRCISTNRSPKPAYPQCVSDAVTKWGMRHVLDFHWVGIDGLQSSGSTAKKAPDGAIMHTA